MAKNTSKRSAAAMPNAPNKAAVKAGKPTAAKAGSNASAIIALLRRDGGANLEEMMSATGWQKHSVRGFMAGALKKQHGLVVSSDRTDAGRVYRIVAEAQQ